MMTRRVSLFIFCALSSSAFCLSPPILLAAFEQRGIGARALALGSAFAAVQDDVLAIFWNPSALATLQTRELEFTYQDLYSEGLVNFSNLAFAYPQIGPGGFGIAWTRLGVTNKAPFEYSENIYSFAYGLKVNEAFFLGTSFNYFRLASAIKGSGLGANVGLRYRPLKTLALGGIYENALRTTVRYDSGAEDDLPNDLRLGGALGIRNATVYLDSNRLLMRPYVHAGVEASFFDDALSLRGGVSRMTDKNFSWIYSLGFGVKVRALGLDYAFENHFDLGPSHIVSVKWRF